MTEPSRRVRSTDGVELAVYEDGPADGPVLVAVHGYPDNHAVWGPLFALLADRFRCVSYDVRGAGASDKPQPVAAYRMPQLIDDLASVIDAVSPRNAVQLLGHDWGSMQGWAGVTDDRLVGRIAGYTSISGPSIDYAAAWLRRAPRRAALRQLAHSTYIAAFQLPALPELLIRRGALDRVLDPAGYRTEADKLNGLKLYRANMLGRVSRPRPRPTDVPVQLIVLEHDAFVTPALALGAPRPWVADLTVHRLLVGHWAVHEQPAPFADLVAGFAG